MGGGDLIPSSALKGLEMNSDIRIQTTFFQHPKILKLIKRSGSSAPLRLIQLWMWTSQNRPDGILDNLEDEDIEIAARAESGFVDTLRELRLLEGEPNSRKVHNWEKHNPWAAGAEFRSAKARFAGLCSKHDKKKALSLLTAKEKQLLDIQKSARSQPVAKSSSAPLLSSPYLTLPKDKTLDATASGKTKTAPPAGKNGEASETRPKRKTVKLRDKTFAPESPGRFVQLWHIEYEKAKNCKYSGDIVKMMGQVSTLLKKVSYDNLCIARQRFMDEKPDEFNNYHNFDTFIKRFNEYREMAKKDGYSV